MATTRLLLKFAAAIIYRRNCHSSVESFKVNYIVF